MPLAFTTASISVTSARYETSMSRLTPRERPIPRESNRATWRPLASSEMKSRWGGSKWSSENDQDGRERPPWVLCLMRTECAVHAVATSRRVRRQGQQTLVPVQQPEAAPLNRTPEVRRTSAEKVVLAARALAWVLVRM